MTPRSILLVTQYAPPSPLVAARRAAGMTKYLGRMGHSVTVLTSVISGAGAIPGAERVIRTRDLLASPLNWRRAHFESLKGKGEATYAAASPIEPWIVPDLSVVGWIPFALPRALGLARRNHFDCVVTSSPPESAHLVGLALKRLRGLPWIADFRDAWTFERRPSLERPLAAEEALDRALERAVARGADTVVGVTEPIAQDLARRFGTRAVGITNGFDPEEGADPEDAALDLPEGKHLLVHTGRMAVGNRSPRHVLDALLELARSSPETASALELVFAGPLTEEERGLIQRPELAGRARWVGALDRKRVLGLQRRADSLLLFTEADRKGHVPAKLYEYFAAGKPILVLGDDVEAARMVREAGAGIAIVADDPSAIAGALRELLEGSVKHRFDPHGIERYAYPRLAASLGMEIEALT
jgi:glycosyltransferase involved in cell wall biosynthesis